MSFRKSAVAALAAVSMVVIPTVAQAAAADSLSVRAGAEASDERELGGGSIIIAIIAAAAIIAGIVIAADGDDDPASP